MTRNRDTSRAGESMDKMDADYPQDKYKSQEGTTLGENMELLEIGLALKAERERKKLSLEKVYEDTRIGLGFLVSLEQGKIEHLPHPAYARGFVRSYANYLGLDGDRIAADFSRVFRADDQFKKINPNEIPTSLKTAGKTLRSPNYTLVLGIFLVGAIAAGLGWLLYSSFHSGPAVDTQETGIHGPPPDDASPMVTRPFMPETPGDLMANEDETAGEATPETEALHELEDTLQPEDIFQGEVLVPDPALEAVPEDESPEFQVSNSDPGLPDENGPTADQNVLETHNRLETIADEVAAEKSILVVRAREDCWLKIDFDQSSREAYLRPGESVRVEFGDFARIILGNAGGVDIFVNGEAYPFEAVSGQVKTIRISSSEDSPS